MVPEGRADEDSMVTEGRAFEASLITEGSAVEVGPGPEGRAVETGPVAECCALEESPMTEDRVGKAGIMIKLHAREVGPVPEGRAVESGAVAKGRAGEASAAEGEGFAIIFTFSPFGAPPLALGEIGVVTKFESRKIDLIFRRFGKIDACEGHAHGPIVLPRVPGVLALRREGEKELLVVFFVGHQISGKSLREVGQSKGKTEFLDLALDGERADERHGVAKRRHAHRLLISIQVGRACLRHERRKDPKIKPVKAIPAQSKPRGGARKTAAIIGKRPTDTHDNDPEAVDREPRNFDGDPERVDIARRALEPPFQPDMQFLMIDTFEFL